MATEFNSNILNNIKTCISLYLWIVRTWAIQFALLSKLVDDCDECTYSKWHSFCSYTEIVPFSLDTKYNFGDLYIFFSFFQEKFTFLFKEYKKANKQYVYCVCDNLVSKCMECLLNTFNTIYGKAFAECWTDFSRDTEIDRERERMNLRRTIFRVCLENISLASNWMRVWVQFSKSKMHIWRIFECFVMPTIWLLFYCYHKFKQLNVLRKEETRSNKSECFWLKYTLLRLVPLYTFYSQHTLYITLSNES